MEPHDAPNRDQSEQPTTKPTYESLLEEVEVWRSASEHWKKVEQRAVNLQERYEALVIAARMTSHGDHDYDADAPPSRSCYLCAAIEGRFQPQWMDEPRVWLRSPIVKEPCPHLWSEVEGGRRCERCGKFDRRYDL